MYINKINQTYLNRRTYVQQQNTVNQSSITSPINLNNEKILPNYDLVDKSLVNFTSKDVFENSEIGCKKEKDILNDILIDPIKSRTNMPPAILLGFPNYEIKKDIENCFFNNRDDAIVIKLDGKSEDLINRIRKLKITPNYSNKPILVMVDNAESVIGMTPAYAKSFSLVPLSEYDMYNLREAKPNLEKVNFFKSFLDKPEKKEKENENENENDLVFLFLTEKPYLIHPDLITRDGKVRNVLFPALGTYSYFPEEIDKMDSYRNLEHYFNADYDKNFSAVFSPRNDGGYAFYYKRYYDPSVNLYYGDCGYNKEILWVDARTADDLYGVMTRIDEIKAHKHFKDIKYIQLGQYDYNEIRGFYKIPKLTHNGKQIYEKEIT